MHPALRLIVVAAMALGGCRAAGPSIPVPSIGELSIGESSMASSSLAGASITASADPSITALPSIDPEWTELPLVSCGSGGPSFPSALLDGPGIADMGLDPADAALRTFIAEPDAEEMPVPNTGWRRVVFGADHAMYLAPTDREPGWFVVAFALHDGEWTADQYGSCQPQVALPNGIGAAAWRLDPAAPPDAAVTSVNLLATEIACASGKAPDGRVLQPRIKKRSDVIGITVLVRHAEGGQDCPANPEFRVTVELGERLGERGLVDTSVFPPARR